MTKCPLNFRVLVCLTGLFSFVHSASAGISGVEVTAMEKSGRINNLTTDTLTNTLYAISAPELDVKKSYECYRPTTVVKWNGTKWEDVGPVFTDAAICLGMYKGELYVGVSTTVYDKVY